MRRTDVSGYKFPAILAVLTMFMGACGKPDLADSLDASVARPAAVDRQRAEARLFISGHSLVDRPMPDDLERVAASLGTPLQWNRQYVVGSSIQTRTRGLQEGGAWQGYRDGLNREGEGLDVLRELAQPQTITGGPYDVLLITEQHGLLDALLWNDTARYLRHYHDQFIAANNAGTTYFYEPWLELSDKNDPAAWIAYEKDVSPIWQCLATRINVALAHEGRADRIVTIPAGLSLVHLIEQSTGASSLEGVTRGNTKETIDSLFADNVHLTPLGAYYVSLVTYAGMFRRDPLQAWHPEDISSAHARVLQQIASEFVRQYYEHYQPLTLAQCREKLANGTITHFVTYLRDARWRRDMGSVRAYVQWLRMIAQSKYALSRNDHRNAFYFDPTTDRAYWLSNP